MCLSGLEMGANLKIDGEHDLSTTFFFQRTKTKHNLASHVEGAVSYSLSGEMSLSVCLSLPLP